MKAELYVGALPYSVSESQLQEIFLAHGTVESTRVIKGRFTGQSRGFGFVVMSSQAEAGKAIEALNGTQVQGRTIVVREARLQLIRKILAPTDLSVKSIAGMAYAISLARENSAELLFLHVIEAVLCPLFIAQCVRDEKVSILFGLRAALGMGLPGVRPLERN